MSELVVVAAERQVEIVAAEGGRAETLRTLEERLVAAFLQNTRFADAPTTRAALAMSLPQAFAGDPRMASLLRLGAAWERTLDAVDDALGDLRARGVAAGVLGVLEEKEPVAGVLRRAMNALDARLERAKLVDERLRGHRLGEALGRAPVEEVVRVVGARRVRARFVVRWDASCAAWWRALGVALARAGGGAAAELPVVKKPIDASRASDPFEDVVARTARLLDDAPVEVDVPALLGDGTFRGAVTDATRERVAIRRGLDADAQARAVVAAVAAAMDDGAPTDRIAVGVPRGASASARVALARQFREAGIALHAFGGEETSALGDAALGWLEAGAAGLPRHDVAALLRAGAVDPSDVAGIGDRRAARAALRDLADALERTPTAERDEPLERLVATAVAADSPARPRRGALARRAGDALLGVARPAARAEHARRARALFAQMGLAARAGGAVRAALARDDPRAPLVRAELEAYAREARALDALGVALAAVERADASLGGDPTCSAETFVHELRRAMHGHGVPGAARAGAVRAASLESLAGEPLDLLVVIDANDGVLPARSTGAGVATPALEDALDPDRCDAALSFVELAAASADARRVVLCSRNVDDDGALLAPSPLVSWLERGGVPSTLVHSAPLLGAPATLHERDLALLALAPDRAPQLAPHAARVAARESERAVVHATGDASSARLAVDDELRALLTSETGGGARPMSVTALERIARCPFQGFAAQVFGALDDDPRTADTPDRREEGILAHEALGAAFTAAADLWPARPRDSAAIVRAALAAADAVLARSGGALVRAALDRIHAEVARLVALGVEDEAWDFAFAERGFGNDGDDWPALVIERDGQRVALRGRIDRIDRSHETSSVRAIDYKRRVQLPAIAELGSTAIQVPIYALVARRSLGAREARGRYLSTVSPVQSSSAGFDARFDEVVAQLSDGSSEATRSALERVVALRRGEIEPVPSAPKWCVQCGLDGACRRPRFAVTMLGREEGE